MSGYSPHDILVDSPRPTLETVVARMLTADQARRLQDDTTTATTTGEAGEEELPPIDPFDERPLSLVFEGQNIPQIIETHGQVRGPLAHLFRSRDHRSNVARVKRVRRHDGTFTRAFRAW